MVKKICMRLLRILTGRKGVYCRMGRKNRFCPGVFLHEMTEVGSHNYFGHGTMTLNARIGSYCSVASNVKIGQMEHDLTCVSTNTKIMAAVGSDDGFREPTVIGNDVWIGANAVIRQGVTVGTGAVIGAGAVVTKDIPPYAVAVGVPAKVLRFRFDEAVIGRLLASRWWELPEQEAIEKCRELQESIHGENA